VTLVLSILSNQVVPLNMNKGFQRHSNIYTYRFEELNVNWAFPGNPPLALPNPLEPPPNPPKSSPLPLPLPLLEKKSSSRESCESCFTSEECPENNIWIEPRTCCESTRAIFHISSTKIILFSFVLIT